MDDNFKSILIDQKTRWVSIANMVIRFTELYDPICVLAETDEELALLLPSHSDMNKIRALSIELKNIRSFTVGMQKSSINMLIARKAFSSLEEKYGENFSKYLSEDARIVLNPDFDNGLVKTLKGEELSMTENDRIAVEIFRLPTDKDDVGNENAVLDLSEFEIIERNAKRMCQRLEKGSSIYDINHIKNIQPTSCDLERLFSKAKNIFTSVRNRTTPKAFEARLMLSENRNLWMNEYDGEKIVNYRGWEMMEKEIRRESAANRNAALQAAANADPAIVNIDWVEDEE